MYLWNAFTIISCRPDLLEAVIRRVDSVLLDMSKSDAPRHHLYYDEFCLALLIKGVCLRHRNQFGEAEQCFQQILSQYVLFTCY